MIILAFLLFNLQNEISLHFPDIYCAICDDGWKGEFKTWIFRISQFLSFFIFTLNHPNHNQTKFIKSEIYYIKNLIIKGVEEQMEAILKNKNKKILC